MKTKKWMSGLLGLALTLTCLSFAQAQPNDPDSAQIKITITPNIDLGVSIDTSNVVMNLGSVDLYGTAQTVRPATVTILGTQASDGSENTGQELSLTLSFVSGGTAWGLDTTPSTHAVSGTLDQLAVYALFSDTGLSVAPTGNDFATDAAGFTSATQRAGGATTNGVLFEKTGSGAKNMDHQSAGDKAHLWMLFRLPNLTTSGTAQEITLTANAVSAS